MQIIRKKAYARAGLIGNPSDGYDGKTISIVVGDFCAQVVLYEWHEVDVMWSQEDRSRFRSVHELVHDVRLHGYYGGVRLVKATIKKFVEYCQRMGHDLHDRNFTVRYESNIPRQVGLAGSSAIIIATLRALCEFYNIEIPLPVQPSLAISVESEELGITAGLQDRVIQVYQGMVYMDFSDEARSEVDGYSCGKYESLDIQHLPNLYIAYNVQVSEPTEVFHNDLRSRFNRGESAVIDAMSRLADLTVEARDAILKSDPDRLSDLINENFDIRKSLCRLPADQVEMVTTARSVRASAKFAGSGGAIVGTFQDDPMYDRLRQEMKQIGCRVIRPRIVEG